MTLYTIHRYEVNNGQGYRFELHNSLLNCVVLTAFSQSAIAPLWFRKAQQRMNRKAVLG